MVEAKEDWADFSKDKCKLESIIEPITKEIRSEHPRKHLKLSGNLVFESVDWQLSDLRKHQQWARAQTNSASAKWVQSAI